MISFDKKQNVVKLNNGSISYWIYINSEGTERKAIFSVLPRTGKLLIPTVTKRE